MSQITIRNMPASLEERLRKLARAGNTSLNKTIQTLLYESLGLTGDSGKKRDLTDLSGSWTESEAKLFEESIHELDQIDEKMWK